MFSEFAGIIHEKMLGVIGTQSQVLDEVTNLIYETVRNDGIVHMFGSGHSHLAAEDCLYRAGCFAPVNPILPSELILGDGAVMATENERKSGIAEKLLKEYEVCKKDIIIIFSNSGINSVPVEMAMLCKEKGLKVVCITSLLHSKQAFSRNTSEKKLYEICDYVIDNSCEYGDACIQLENGTRVAPVSTIMGVFIAQGLFANVARIMINNGETPPVYISANLNNSDGINDRLIQKYKNRVRHL